MIYRLKETYECDLYVPGSFHIQSQGVTGIGGGLGSFL